MNAPTRLLAALCASLAISLATSVFAQTPAAALPFDFEYGRYDAAAPELPDDYPAKHYTTEQLLKRFVEIAEGPELSREEIEREFGLRFVKLFERAEYDGVARGRYPLGNDLSRYSDYRMGKDSGRIFISLHLRDRILGANGKQPTWSKPALCVSVTDFYKALNSGWRRVERGHGSHYPFNVYFLRLIDGKTREVMPSPAARSAHECIQSFNLVYDSEPNPNLPPRP